MAAPIVTPEGLTSKQETFAQFVAGGASLHDAYLQSYDVAPTTQSSTVDESASRLAAQPKVAARIQQLVAAHQAATIAQIAWDQAHLVKEADRHRELALSGGWRGVSAANGALEIIGKVTGLLRPDILAVPVPASPTSGLDSLTAEELRTLIAQREEMLALMRAGRVVEQAPAPTLELPAGDDKAPSDPLRESILPAQPDGIRSL